MLFHQSKLSYRVYKYFASNLLYFSCYAADDKTLEYIIFEDLTKSGYKNVPKTDGLDFCHIKIAFKKLADWHAATAVIVNVNKIRLKNEMRRLNIINCFLF